MPKILGILLAIVLLGGGAAGWAAFRTPTPGPPVDVTIPQGAATRQIAQILEENDVIRSVLWFRVMTRIRGLDGRLRAGRFELRRGMGASAALDSLRTGRALEDSVSLTVPEGFSMRQIAERVGGQTHIGEEEFLEVVTSGEVRSSIQPDEVDILEGLLFPETYVINERETAEGLARRMVREVDRRLDGLDWTVPETAGLSRYEVMIMASLVEREARVPEDREMIAAVLYNRLEEGMRLQIDITALYGLDEHKVPTRADLRRESPYNTYLIDGLPPTPIASPGLAAIESVLAPAASDALFYVVIDPSGRHGFTRDYQEFLRLQRLRPPEVRGGTR